MARLALIAAALGMSAVTGCATPAVAPATAAHVAQPEVVALDFFGSKTATASCSGTLLAPRVVLTAAHCTTNGTQGFVNAPDASGQTAAVKTVHIYDWTADGDHTVQHDLAVVVLSKSVKVASYPTVWSHNADGLSATQARRTKVVALDASVARRSIAIANGRPAGNTFTLYVPNASSDAGGGLFGTDSSGHRQLVGVMLGKSATTSGGYAARVADSTVRAWIAGIVANPSGGSASTAHDLSHLKTLDGDDDDGASVGDDDDATSDAQQDNAQDSQLPDTTNEDPATTQDDPEGNATPASATAASPASASTPAANANDGMVPAGIDQQQQSALNDPTAQLAGGNDQQTAETIQQQMQADAAKVAQEQLDIQKESLIQTIQNESMAKPPAQVKQAESMSSFMQSQ